MSDTAVVSLRMSPELLREADELVPLLRADPRYRSLPRLGRSAVLRLALDMGLHELRVHLATAPMLKDAFDKAPD